MNTSIFFGLSLLIGTTSFAYAGSTTLPIRKNQDELRLLENAREFDRIMVNTHRVFEHEKSDAYITTIATKLFGTDAAKLNIQLVNLATPKAYALPNGTIYIHVGLISKLENESELAFIIGHEATHIFARHSLQERLLGKNSADHARSESSDKHFSYSQELSADKESIARLRAAGYDISSISNVFHLLSSNAATQKKRRPRASNTHPTLSSREKVISNLLKHSVDKGDNFQARFLNNTSTLRSKALLLAIEFGQYEYVHNVIKTQPKVKELEFYEFMYAECLRHDGADENLELAKNLYEQSIRVHPSHEKSHLGLALTLSRLGSAVEASNQLKIFEAMTSELKRDF